MKVNEILLLKSNKTLVVYICTEVVRDIYERTIYSFKQIYAINNGAYGTSEWFRGIFTTDKLDQVIFECSGEMFITLEECIAAHPEDFI